eukprot:g35927.t1
MGPDNIPAKVLKNWAPELAAPLAKLFQYSYNTGIYPTMWKIAQGFTCTSSNLVYCICCSRCDPVDIGETKRRLGDRFAEHLLSLHEHQQHLP